MAGVLSGGQLRRLGLAMELTTQPSLLLADEVTSGLDPKSEEEITELLSSLSQEQGRLVLLVTHSLRSIEVCLFISSKSFWGNFRPFWLREEYLTQSHRRYPPSYFWGPFLAG